MPKNLETQWPKEWTQLLAITLPKTENSKLCQNHKPNQPLLERDAESSPESHQHNRWGIISGRAAWFQIMQKHKEIDLQLSHLDRNKKHLQHQLNLLQTFFDFKNVFDGIWHKGLRKFTPKRASFKISKYFTGAQRPEYYWITTFNFSPKNSEVKGTLFRRYYSTFFFIILCEKSFTDLSRIYATNAV